ncbi:hypothetical protein GMA12_17495 [Kocuria sediminis]|uniref:Alkaline shock response membrane anchor protein AmaP n=1 Tax=Kocuria sediminis TaxID=1038857 RepID=A0A6N8GRV0_9MICC|nr:hypothetical protein [Kocuria sediminis]MUN64912.1 hypothetical protein [Kocuria sediminis]
MRTVSGVRNRILLTVLGLVLVLVGAWLVLVSTGAVSRAPGLGDLAPADGAALGDLLGPLGQVLLPVGTALVVLTLIGALWWLIHQIPTKDRPVDYRLHQDDDHGAVTIAPSVIATAVRTQCEELPGVKRASVDLSGSAREPELFLDLLLTPGASVERVLDQVYGTVVADLTQALEVELAHVAVRLDVSRAAAWDTRTAVQEARPRGTASPATARAA